MSTTQIALIHGISVLIFLVLYLIKTVLLFSNVNMLDKFIKATKVIEMIISVTFLVSGLWLLFVLGAIKTLFIIKFILVFVSIPIAVIGFKRRNKIFASLALLLIVGAYGMSEAAKKKPFKPVRVEITGNADESAKIGIRTYMANCAMCHGEKGEKKYRDATDLTVSGLNQEGIELIVREGTTRDLESGQVRMPAFAGTLTDEEISAVSAYVQTLRGQ